MVVVYCVVWVSQEQYVCVHEAVVVMFQRQLELMQDHCDYYNIAPKHSVVSRLASCLLALTL